MLTARKIDRRARRSQQLLGDALLTLILKKGYEAITIKDITEQADVAYVTFFRHYASIDDLLQRRLADELTELRERIETAARETQAGQGDTLAGQMIFEHARDHRALFQVLLGSQGALPARQHVQATIASIFRDSCRPLRESHLVPAEVAANHMAAALLALIEWWLAHEMPYPPDHMARIYDRLVIAATINGVLAG